MKRLWKHIAECKDQKCLVPHCVSSRYVLSHYHRCKDVRCPVCGPVREAIHRSHEKQKQMQALKQRHQQAVQQNQNEEKIPAGAALAPPPVQHQQGFGYPSKPQPMSQQPGVPSTASVPPKITVPPIAGVKFANGQVITPKFTGPKPQEDHTLINCFSVEQIETHIKSLNKGLQLPPLKLKVKCLEVLKVLQGHQHGWVFNSPVDPIELGLPDYFEVIKIPMDLGTIRKKLENGCYHSLDSFHTHVHTTFDNAMLYNPEGSVVYNMANEMKTKFKQDFEILMKQLNADEDVKRRNGEACSLCGCEKLLFEPPVFYCNGLSCPSKRIRRNSYYYVGGNNQYHWCHQCFQELKDNQLLELADVSIRKEQLTKKKNDETHEESWVQCDRCERWVHQICALFNTRQNKDQRSEFACPRCTIEERKKTGRLEATSSTPMAEDLQRTKLSEYVETHVRVKMAEHLKELAEEKVLKEGMDLEEAKASVTMGGTITIRQVTSMDRKLEVRERMKKRYAFKNYPDEFTYRCKCFVVFQNLDGVDVILFGLYVYEHDEKNPAPNQRAVYVSYLDSVHYMRPRSMRTFIYHEILISYLDYVRRRGFSTAHIWACPPLKGDDYILYAKPEDQKTPKDDRLRQWYIDMLIDCQKRGIVGRLTNMYDLYFSSKENNATIVPYMEGDYFPAEVENIIKDIEEGKVGKKTGGKEGKKKKGDKKQKKKGGRGGTRSSGIDEDALKASGIQFPGKDQKSLEEGGRDYVMVKLGETIQPMKESFIVAHLAWKGAKKENMVVPRAIQEYREKHNIKIEDEKEKETEAEPAPVIYVLDSKGRRVKVIDDDAEEMDCEFLNNRQAFLNLCQGNHYQYDHLRRAKHSSMMVLWHLHNRDAPKFVQQCTTCSREILQGYRFHCPICADFDQCQDCVQNPNTPRHPHQLKPIAVAGQQTELTEAQRKERQRSIQLHMTLLQHAATCNSTKCPSANCTKMKGLLKHGSQCTVKATGGCNVCKRIWALLQIHARQCKAQQCPVPNCMAIRERVRQLKKQQQAMDDRRRQEMNRVYRGAR
ncbi:DUF906-domain-containing protein [Fragilariopsis cylindrus CCMP1102]|uniref:histone acetyltransferase n=1 Tax=Fragilariopsis cylindrus CCMP1102 TaxID=635003 RepID=A0A1E7FGE5_9STRA|nr:DUF906-domain-containing protein [Fragilariopsis cylindrus CCMP1102]|eukprot:OEU17226.1 DUF906-domain-containing protein [Fragilariopsis cylindrus CCMP1102]